MLGEILTELLGDAGLKAQHRRQLGGTRLLWDALLAGQIDVYPEYTGTITHEILPQAQVRSDDEIRKALAQRGVGMSGSLGFNDTYAIGVTTDLAQRLGLEKISDLAAHPSLRLGFSNEFMDRADGWPSLRRAYNLPQSNIRGLDHDLAYRALASGAIDATDLYSTDAEIRYYHLKVLRDDLNHFPRYDAVMLYRLDLERHTPGAVEAIRRLEGKISDSAMIDMNAAVKIDKRPDTQVGGTISPGVPGHTSSHLARDHGRTRLATHGRAPVPGWHLDGGGDCALRAAGNCGRQALGGRTGDSGHRGSLPDDSVAGLAGVHDPAVGDRNRPGHSRPVSLQPVAHCPQHVHRPA